MTVYAIRRVLIAIPVILGVVVFSFAILHFVPGDPARQMAGTAAPQEAVDALREELGLSEPLLVQLAQYVGGVVTGDLGTSLRSGRPVLDELATPLVNTYVLVVASMALALLVGVPLGIIAAINRGRLIDRVAVIFAAATAAFPSFLIGLLFVYFIGFRWGWLPISGWRTWPWEPDWWKYAILPVITLSSVVMPIIVRITRSCMLDVLGEEFVRTARSKGLAERLVILRHAFRTAMIPLVTIVGVTFGYFLGGAVVTETIFSVPGLGRLLVDGIAARDYPVVQGAVLLFAMNFVIINLLTDLAYGLIDPRVKY